MVNQFGELFFCVIFPGIKSFLSTMSKEHDRLRGWDRVEDTSKLILTERSVHFLAGNTIVEYLQHLGCSIFWMYNNHVDLTFFYKFVTSMMMAE